MQWREAARGRRAVLMATLPTTLVLAGVATAVPGLRTGASPSLPSRTAAQSGVHEGAGSSAADQWVSGRGDGATTDPTTARVLPERAKRLAGSDRSKATDHHRPSAPTPAASRTPAGTPSPLAATPRSPAGTHSRPAVTPRSPAETSPRPASTPRSPAETSPRQTAPPRRATSTASRQASAASHPGSAGAFSLSKNDDGSLVRWDPCRTIGYKVNARGATGDALADVQNAVARLEQATGLNLRYDGATSQIPTADNAPTADDIVVAWARPGQSDALYGNAAGTGGWFERGHYTSHGLSWQISGGYVVLDANQNGAFRRGFGPGIRRGTLLLHELGHVVGLRHVSDRNQVMYPDITSHAPGVWGAGDLGGLHKLGRAGGCLS